MKLSELVDNLVKLQNMLDHDPKMIVKGDHDTYVEASGISYDLLADTSDYYIESIEDLHELEDDGDESKEDQLQTMLDDVYELVAIIEG